VTNGWIRIGPRPVSHAPRFAVDPNALPESLRAAVMGNDEA
jgi:hypothetical protein